MKRKVQCKINETETLERSTDLLFANKILGKKRSSDCAKDY